MSNGRLKACVGSRIGPHPLPHDLRHGPTRSVILRDGAQAQCRIDCVFAAGSGCRLDAVKLRKPPCPSGQLHHSYITISNAIMQIGRELGAAEKKYSNNLMEIVYAPYDRLRPDILPDISNANFQLVYA